MTNTAAYLRRGLAGAALVLVASAVGAAETDYFDRFTGAWVGGGIAQRDLGATPREVTCKVTGKRQENTVSVSGRCRAYLVFTRSISVDLTYDEASETYSGTYVGSRLGPAPVEGKRDGDALDLTITWPKVTNGDREAAMRIENTGDGRLRLILSDRPAGNGELMTLTDLTFQKEE